MWLAVIAGKQVYGGNGRSGFLEHCCFAVRRPCNLATSQFQSSGEGVLGIVHCQLFHPHPLDVALQIQRWGWRKRLSVYFSLVLLVSVRPRASQSSPCSLCALRL